ncbi:MAG: Lrp/AsnC family transcriptional regulator [Haloferacaceae archaeon]
MPDSSPATVDGVDYHVLNTLLADGRASFRAVSDRVGVSATTVSNRVRALERRGVIEGFEPRLDYAALGYDTVAAFQLRVAGAARDRVRDRLVSYRTVTDAFEVASHFDLLAVARFRDTDAVGVCARELAATEGVTELQTTIALDVARSRRQFRLPPDGLSRDVTPGRE